MRGQFHVSAVSEEAMELLSYRSHQCPLCFPGSSHFGRLRASLGPGLGLLPKGFYFAPFPGPPLSGSPPLAGSALGRSAPGAPLPGRWGSPLFVFAPSLFPLFFRPSQDHQWVRVSSRRANWLAPVWLKVRFRQVHKRLCLKPPSGQPTKTHSAATAAYSAKPQI